MKFGDTDSSDLSDSESSISSNSDNEACDSTQHGRALQLITFKRSNDFDETLHLHLEENVLNTVLESCKGKPICLISAVGYPRTGKSFIMNFLKEKLAAIEDDDDSDEWISQRKDLQGFQWRHGYKPTTQGIQIWSKAYMVTNADGKDIAVLLMDTQGINEETPPDERSAILGISLLLSSISIINVASDIPEELFNWLQTFVKYGNSCVSKGISEPFQKLSFLVRDWTRLSEHSFGTEAGSKFLSKLLSNQQKFSKQIYACWEELECTLLPNIGSKALLKTFTGQASHLNTDFVKRLKALINNLISEDNIMEKRILGNSLTSYELNEFLRSYLEMFNSKTEMELGLKPERIWSATVSAAIAIKVNKGLAAYQKVFKLRKDACFGNYLKDATIDGVNVHAISAAKESFRSLKIPKEDEKEAERKLDQVLKEETEQLKKENEGQRRTQVTEGVSQACTKLREILSAEFPFQPEETFYDQSQFQQKVASSVSSVKAWFLDQFDGEDEDGVEKLNDMADSVLDPIQEEYISRNEQNKLGADNRARSTVKDLIAEYLADINDWLRDVPTTDASTLNKLHSRTLNAIMKKFTSENLGSADYQNKWREKLEEEIEEERAGIELGLESTMASALATVKNEVANYRDKLKVQAAEMDEVDLIQWHEEELNRIMRNGQANIPFPAESTKGEMVLRKLRSGLELAYTEIVEEGIMVKRQQEEELDNARATSFQEFKREIDQFVEDNDFLETPEFKKFVDKAKEKMFRNFFTPTSIDDAAVALTMGELSGQVDSYGQDAVNRNEERREFMNSLADSERKALVQSYNSNLQTAAIQMKIKEELETEHNKEVARITDTLKANINSKNQAFVDRHIQEMISSVEQSFAQVEEYFTTLRNTETATLMSAMLAVQTEYTDNMNNHFSNKSSSGAFTNDELAKLHKDAVKTASNKIPAGLTLTKEQKSQVFAKLEEIFKTYTKRNDLVFRSFDDGEPAIGIDLGTTYCCVAVYLNGKVQIIPNAGTGDYTTPSYVRINADNSMDFGSPAKDLAHQHDPEVTIFDAKRLIGRRFDESTVQNDIKYWPFSVVDHDGGPKILVNGKHYFPEEISGFLLKHLKDEASKWLNKEVKKAVITVPAYFTDGQRQATKTAGELAGLEVVAILNEPSSAAVAFKMDNVYDDKKRNVLVYDLGGGTFDVAVLMMDKGNIEVLAVEGDSHLGGEDFDKNLMKYCAEQFAAEKGVDIFLNKDSPNKTLKDEARRNIRRLQTQCEIAKKSLSTAPAYTISIDSFAGHDLVVKIAKKTFEDKNRALFQDTIKVVDKALNTASLKKEEIDEIVLVGGSTKIPLIRKMLSDHFNGKALSHKIDPDQAVAQGAAIQAAMICANPKEKLFDFTMIREVTPMSLGIEMATGSFDTIIPKGSKIPITEKQVYETHRDDQESAWIKIFQGEEQKAADNKLLGDFQLEGIPPGKAGTERVEVEMHIDNNGILNVEAVCVSNRGTKKKMTVCAEKGIMSKEVKKRLIAEGKTSAGRRG